MAITNPCYKCEERKAECHSACENYREWQAGHLEYTAAVKRERYRDREGTNLEVESALRRKRR